MTDAASPDSALSGDDAPAGDPVCWLERVCDACGALEDGPPAPGCARCGAPRPTP